MSDPHHGGDTSPRGRYLLGLLVFLLGGCGLAYEYTLSKIAADLLGNSVQQWTMMIAVILFAMGLGAEWQSKIPTSQIADRLVFSQVLLAVIGGFGPMMMVYSFAIMANYYIVVQYGIALIVGTLIGFEIPLIMRINEVRDPEMKNNLARILKMDYIGALVGALLWTFLLIRYLSISRISFILGFISVVSATLVIIIYWQQIKKPGRRIGEVALATILLATGLTLSKPLMLHAEQYLYRDLIVFTETTPYQHIVLTKNSNKMIHCYINGHLQFSEQDEFIYHENLVHPAMILARSTERVLILGGGDGLAVREIRNYPKVKEITLVDIDPQMTMLARSQPDLVRMNQGSLDDPRLQITPAHLESSDEEANLEVPNRRENTFFKSTHQVATIKVINLDAASFLKNARGQYDVVILDFPDPNSPDLAKLYSKPFYMSLRKHLAPSAIIVQQSGSSFHAREAFLCIGRTLRASGFSALPYHDNVPSFGEWGWWIGCLSSYQSEGDLRSAILNLPDDALVAPTRYLTVDLMKSSLSFGKNQLISKHQDITTLTENRIYHYYLQGWKK